MAVTNGWGQGVENNTIEWGKGKDNATNNWGKVYETSASGDTLLEVATPSFSNTKSVDFDGVDDYVDLGNPTELQFTSSFSISLWFKSTDTSDYILISKDKTNGHLTNERSWGLWGNRFGGTNVIIFNVRNGSSNFYVAGTTDHNDGNWHHVVATFEASTNLKLYVDGSLEAENPQWNLPATINNVTTNVGIGTSVGSNLWFMNGKIDEVGLFNGVLSASDVTAIYNSGTPLSLSSYSPLAWYRMGDNDTFPTLTDNGSGGNNGTMTNMVSGDIVADVAPTFNKFSIDFDGADDHITMGNVLDFSKTDSFSFSCWIKRDALGSEQVILGKIDNASPYKGYELALLSGNTYRVMFRNSNPAYQRFIRNSSSTIADTNWHHIAFTYDGSGSVSGVNLYLDGSLDNGSTTGTLNSDMTNSFPFCISSRNQATAFFSGLVDEVSVFNSELSASNITAIYNSGEPNDISALNPLSWWRFEEGSGTTATDSGSGGNDGTITNGATYSTDKP